MVAHDRVSVSFLFARDGNPYNEPTDHSETRSSSSFQCLLALILIVRSC